MTRQTPATGTARSGSTPTQNLYFKFVGSRNPTINQDWLDQLMLSANSARGLLVMREGSSAEGGRA